MPGILFFNPRAVQYKEMSTEDHGSWINCAVERNTHRSNESWINCANRLISEKESQICTNEDLVWSANSFLGYPMFARYCY